MMLRCIPIIFFLTSSPFVMAETNRTVLIEGCAEAVQIYDNQQEYKAGAALMTSLSEAVRAGYCKGVLDEYGRSHDCGGNWLKRALYIANHKDAKRLPPSTEDLLDEACRL
ncbi:hypothetical protein [Aeromonas salmonicida]|uniref:hypothetical protein n=1 Tax=Aeromonas salmonicida TaxID=645 RepID=UPI00259F25B1|nr:hypothetical protein [Aeromonas salmonicida]MDM5112953.1 hypothetical protein [Aeromonas salmonicida]